MTADPALYIDTEKRLRSILTDDSVDLLIGLADALFPSSDEEPGALTAGALTYIANKLGGGNRDLVGIYDAHLSAIAQRVTQQHAAPISNVTAEGWTALVEELMREAAVADIPLGLSGAPSVEALQQQADDGNGFILLLWQHVREGLFCDPRHGGNDGGVMWQWLGYPGVQLHGYTDYEIGQNERLSRPLRTADDWRGVRE